MSGCFYLAGAWSFRALELLQLLACVSLQSRQLKFCAAHCGNPLLSPHLIPWPAGVRVACYITVHCGIYDQHILNSCQTHCTPVSILFRFSPSRWARNCISGYSGIAMFDCGRMLCRNIQQRPSVGTHRAGWKAAYFIVCMAASNPIPIYEAQA